MLKLTPAIRKLLKKPFGKIYSSDELLGVIRGKIVYAIGDSTLLFLVENGMVPKAAVYDFHCMRAELSEAEKQKIRNGVSSMHPVSVRNPAGEITDDMKDSVERAVRNSGAVFVDGEEDLAALIAMKDAGDGELVLYGQPGKGVVLVEGSKQMREKAADILSRMRKE